MTEIDQAKLEPWERMAKAIIRAYVKLPMARHNATLNGELGDLAEQCKELEPALKGYYPIN